MDDERQQRYFDLGENYWWLRGKYDFLLTYLSWFDNPEHGTRRILDCGCGPGNMYSRLSALGEVYGSDFSMQALAFGRQRGLRRLFRADGAAYPVRANTFDLIVMVDVLEHIADDVGTLRELRRILKPGGALFLTVPAFSVLWGAHDEIYGHFRRYSKGELIAKLQEAGLEVQDSSYFEALFFFPMLLFRRLKALSSSTRDQDDFVPVPRLLNAILRRVISWEAHVVRRWHPPIGVTLLGIARKP